MPVRKLLKSKPVVIAGAATLANKLMQKTRGRKRRRSRALTLATGAVLIGGAVATARWFTDPILGQARRRKLLGKVQPQSHNGQASEITIPEPAETPAPNI